MKGHHAVLNLSMMLEDSAREFPDRDAVVLGDQRMSYAVVEARSNQVANLLAARGIGRGDRVALSCPNIPAFPIVYYGILKAGAVVVPLNILLRDREITYHLEDAGAKAYFCFEGTEVLDMGSEGWAGFRSSPSCTDFFVITADSDPDAPSPIATTKTLAQMLRDVPTQFESVATNPEEPAVVLYTSGTTGKSKGAELSHSNLVLNSLTCHRLFSVIEHDIHLVTLPLFHSFGQVVQMNAGFGAGATLVLLPRFDPDAALSTMQREGVTFFAGVPTMYWGLLSANRRGVDLPRIAANLRMALTGGASIPVELLQQVQDVFGIELHEGYGLSETSPVACFNHPGRRTKPGSIGQPVWGVRMKLIDADWNEMPEGQVGEIAIRGHNVMSGYLGKPDESARVVRNGWIRSGDIGRRDADGYYYIVDRAKDMIIRGGFNVYPREIEEVVMTHPDVSLVAVIGLPHDEYGEEIKAVVIRQPGSDLTAEGLIEWCKQNMAAYKYPRQVEFVEALPMTATGKIRKADLRQS